MDVTLLITAGSGPRNANLQRAVSPGPTPERPNMPD